MVLFSRGIYIFKTLMNEGIIIEFLSKKPRPSLRYAIFLCKRKKLSEKKKTADCVIGLIIQLIETMLLLMLFSGVS